MTSPLRSLEESFQINSALAQAHVNVMHGPTKQILTQWMDKLAAIGTGALSRPVDHLRTRNDYMWLLLLVLRQGRITEPFSSPPPPGMLPPLSTIIPPDQYEELLLVGEDPSEWMRNRGDDDVCGAAHDDDDEETEKQREAHQPRPQTFFETRPLPRDGIRCYFGAFSTRPMPAPVEDEGATPTLFKMRMAAAKNKK